MAQELGSVCVLEKELVWVLVVEVLVLVRALDNQVFSASFYSIVPHSSSSHKLNNLLFLLDNKQ